MSFECDQVQEFLQSADSTSTSLLPPSVCYYPNISAYNTNSSRQPSECNDTCIGDLPLIHHKEIWTPEVIQRVVTLAIIMVFTLIGNITIVIVLTFSKYRKLTSRVNIFIINLAVGDLAVLCFTMTTEIVFVAFEERWMLGPVLCKVVVYVQIVTLASTTFILTAMSYDRFLAVCKPLMFNTSNNTARRLIVIAWVLAFLFASPQLLIFKEVAGGVYPDGGIKYKCASKGYTAWWQRKLYFTFLAAYILVIPSIIISYCYINVVKVVFKQGNVITVKGESALRRTVKDTKSIPRARVRTIKMTLSIICTFIMCWTPYFVVHLIHIWSKYSYIIPGSVYVFAETIALLNSALNPILYGCFNMKIKRGLLEVFCPQRIRARESLGVKSGVSEYVTMTEHNVTRVDTWRGRNRCLQADDKCSALLRSHINRQVALDNADNGSCNGVNLKSALCQN